MIDEIMKWLYSPRFCSDCRDCEHLHIYKITKFKVRNIIKWSETTEKSAIYYYCKQMKGYKQTPIIEFQLKGTVYDTCYHFKLKLPQT